MEFRLLGPVEALRDGSRLALGGAKPRALLALLLLHANEPVSRDRLIDALWGDRPPGTADHSLDVQISRLRKAFEPDELLLTRPGGYVLEIEPEQVDVHRFERLLEEGRRANADGKPAEALDALEAALALWRGGALADLEYETFARPEIDRLEELRLVATEERIDAELALGRHDTVIPELEALVARHPLRERLRGQLMLALYRSGRQAEALRVYSDTRKRLVDDLGIEPGQALKDLEQAILRQDPALDLPRAARATRRRRITAGALVLAVAAAIAAGAVLVTQGGAQSASAQTLGQSDSVALISKRSGKAIGSAEVQAPLYSRFGEGALWNLSFLGILTKIDPATGKVIASVNTGVPVACGLAVGQGSVWVTDCNSPTVVRVDPAQAVVADQFPLPVAPSAPWQASATQSVAVGAGSIWVGQGGDNPSHVYRLDPTTGLVQKPFVIPEGGAEALAFGDGTLWVGGGSIGHLSKIDPRTNEVTAPVQDLGDWMCCVAVGGGYVWAATNPAATVWKISRSGKVVSSIKLAAQIEDLRYADGAVWASIGTAGTVLRIDPTTDLTTTYRVGHHPIGVDARKGVVAVSVLPSGQDVTAGLKGRIVTVALEGDPLDDTSTDPVGTQTSFNPGQVQFQYATCAKLFNYPDATGATGERLEPEVAAGWPTVSNGGRTYTFRIRSGYGFSGDSHEQVTAESFRHEIERFLSPKQPGPWNLELLSDVVGAKAFNSGRAAHISGVSADGDTLVIRLVKPAGDLPTRLARPVFCAVPADLATVPHGLRYPIPSAGPYFLAERSSDVLVLKPNPNYRGPRPQKLDAIVYRTGIDIGTAVADVAQGIVDYVQADDTVLAPNTRAAQNAGARYSLTANNSTTRLALNTSRPLYADVRVRRAVALALDRRTLAHALENGEFQRPTSRLLPPNFFDSIDEPGHPLRADLRTARKLMGGRHVHAVFAADAPAAGTVYQSDFVEALRKQLAAIGITLTVVPLRQDSSPAEWSAVLAHADLTSIGRNADDARDSVGYLLHLTYLPAVDRAQLDRIATLTSPRRDALAIAVAARLERDAVYIGIADSATPEVISKRLGCVVHHPEYPGLDLAALCLRKNQH